MDQEVPLQITDFDWLSKTIVSGFRMEEKPDYYLCRAKRSEFIVRIPKTIGWKISYLAGVIAGDGSIKLSSHKLTKYPRTCIEIFNNSLDYLNFVNDLFVGVFDVRGRLRKKRDKNCYVLAMNSKVVWLYFTRVLGSQIGRKNHLCIPVRLKNPMLLKHFIAGLIDTDGYKTRTFGLMMGGSNAEFLKEIAELADSFYHLKFRGPYHNCINQNGKVRYRAILSLVGNQNNFQKFKESIILYHPRFSRWARGDLNP